MFLIAVLILVAFFLAAYIFVKNKLSYWEVRGVNHEKPSFPFGNLSGLGKSVSFSELQIQLYEKFKKKGRFFGLYMFLNKVLVITDLELLKTIFIKDFSNFNERGLYHNKDVDPISENLATVDGKTWKTIRSKLSPTFTSAKMKFMFPTVQKVGEEFVDVLKGLVAKNSEIEIKELLARYTTDVIGTCAFGIECNSLKDPNGEFRLYGRKLINYINTSVVRIMFLQSFKKLAKVLRMRFIKKECGDYFMKTVKETVEYRERNNIRRNDFVDLLIDLKNNKNGDNPEGLTIDETCAHSFIFIFAGFETSSSLMGFMLYELARNPEIQSKLRNHINSTLGKHNGVISYECMREMSYLEQVIMETLRMYPIAPQILRLTQENYKIPDSDLVLEKGTSILVPVRAIHNDPDIYSNPSIFDPDRFLPQEVEKRHSQSFLGFGDGPRNCIGSRFAKMQTFIAIVSLIRNFEFTTSNGSLKLARKGFLLGTEGGIYLNMKAL